MSLWPSIAAKISEATGTAFSVERERAIGGGCINSACMLQGDGQRYFVKLNHADRIEMFEAEAQGLNEILQSNTIHAPRPVCWGIVDSQCYLVMEYLELGAGDSTSLDALGRQLARMHHCTAPRYGWDRDNTIGSTPQPNTRCDDWLEFWRKHRLGFQIELAARNGHGGALQRRGEQLLVDLPALLADHRPPASLLHGDLWSGNYAITSDGEPVIFDPAVYYGDREADLAMTELFGGFSPRFYAAYRDEYPIDPGYPVRKTLYNLYHILNHLNLFGAGYRSQAEAMIESLLSEIH